MTDVLQCPYCDLRFSTRSELEQHKSFDHPREQDEPEASAEPEPATVQPDQPGVEPDREPEKRGFLDRLFKRS